MLSTRPMIFWALFLASHLGLFVFGFLKQKNDPELYILNAIGYSVYTSRGAGLVLAFDCALILLPVCKNIIRIARSIANLGRWIPFDDNLYLHKWTAKSMLFFTFVHVNAHYTNFFYVEQKLPSIKMKAWQVHYTTFAGVTGHLMLVIMFLLFTATALQVRKLKFEIFWWVFLIAHEMRYTHHLYFPFFILLFLHSYGCFVKSAVDGHCKGYNSNFFTIPAFLLYFVDRLVRVWRSREETQITNVIFHPGNTVEIRFEKPSFKYKPGQYLYLNIADISRFQWHPFTVSSAPEEGFTSVHIRIAGDWTSELADRLRNIKDALSIPKLRVDGPYGAPAEDLFNYRVAALVSAGIGVTPAASLLKSVWFAYMRKAPMKLEKLYFIWIAREKDDFEWFQSLLSTLEQSVPREFLDIQVYLTGKLCVDDIENIFLNDPLSNVDTITELNTRCQYGRPVWTSFFKSIRESQKFKGPTLNVGIFFCGPPLAGSALEKSARLESSDQIKFKVHSENF